MSAVKEFKSVSLGRTSINFRVLQPGVLSEYRDFHIFGDIIH